jgi:uncharacterized protein (UPF0548 family)
MLCWSRPSRAAIEQFLAEQSQLELSYKGVGNTSDLSTPPGYVGHRYRTPLGSGNATFEAAREAIRSWTMFNVGWVELAPARPPEPEPGVAVGLLFHLAGTWWLSACRVVYLIDEPAPRRRFGFAYGTLPGHVARGEERFLVEQDHDGTVWYDLFSFSHPRHPLARLGSPVTRAMQKRFAHASLEAMRRAVRRAADHEATRLEGN